MTERLEKPFPIGGDFLVWPHSSSTGGAACIVSRTHRAQAAVEEH